MEEKAELYLLYCFESPKKDWTLVRFALKVDTDLESGFKVFECWYPRKGLKAQFTPDMYGQKVEATFKYRNNTQDPSRVTREVVSFEYDDRTYNLV